MRRIWQRPGLAAYLLWPLAVLFGVLGAIRRALYRQGWLESIACAVPVVVVGNISVGGTGKTPLVIALAQALTARGRRVGVISRGYAGEAAHVREVGVDDQAAQVGDEPLLIRRRSGCPVAVGRDRVAAARLLLARHPEVDLLLSDDGLQHYRLGRQVEVAVVDGSEFDNSLLLPAGPLREPLSRLRCVDAVVLRQGAALPAPSFVAPVFRLGLRAGPLYRLDDASQTIEATRLHGLRLHAVAGIGKPQRFFDLLAAQGLDCACHAFPDHHAFSAEDLPKYGDAILTTEKDAVKLAALAISLPVWVLPVQADIEPDLAHFVLEKLHGLTTA